MEGATVSFDELQGLRVLPPSFTMGYYPYGTPIAHENLKKHAELWIEPILPDSFSHDELCGWYQIHAFYAENEYGTKFLFDTYRSKWLAFEQKL